MKTLPLAAALTVVVPGFAQTPAQPQRDIALAAGNALATSACTYTFSSGAANTFLRYCVTVNGNITKLESPQGHEHVAVGAFAEGYMICDNSSHPAVPYYDYADFGETGNWQAATLVSQSATSVKIARTTVDGVWTLTQTITQAAGTGTITVTMALKNNSAIARRFSLVRYIDVDADGLFGNSIDATMNTAFAWQASNWGVLNSGIAMEIAGTPSLDHAAVAHNFPNGPDCHTPATPGTWVNVDGSLAQMFFGQQPLGAGRTATVSIRYRPL